MHHFLDSRELTPALLDALPDALVLVDEEGHIVGINARVSELLGYERSELVGQPVELLVPEVARAPHAQRRGAYGQSPDRRPMAAGRDLTARRKDGSELPVSIALSPVQVAAGLYVIAVLREVPDHRRALRAAEERYRSAIEQAPDAVFVADLAGCYVEVNSAACQLLGYTRPELIGRTIASLLPPEDHARLAASRAQLLEPGAVQVAEWTMLRADGTRLPVEVSAKIHDDGRWQAFVRDITERKQAAELAARTVRELETVLDVIPDPVAIRVDENLAYVNRAWLRALGYDDAREVLGHPVVAHVHPEDRSFARERLHQVNPVGSGQPEELRLLAKDGSSVPLELAASLGLSYRGHPAALVVAHDRREWKRLQAALGERDRLATVGTLAAGVGHEINNPLQHLTMTLELLREELTAASGQTSPGLASAIELVADARRGAERIAKIVRGLHTFARGEREEAAELNLVSVLELSMSLTRNQLRPHVRVFTDLAATPPVFCDESRLAQVFINLLSNAAQAMADQPVERNVLRVCSWTDEQERAVVEIRDSGPGMPEAVRARVFEPFFTTKPVGQGSGLGLAIAHSIVTSLGGDLSCSSQLGVGSTFRVTLPKATRGQAPSEPSPRPSRSAPRRARILVVEDDPVVASLIERVLTAEHDVVRAADGLEGLARLSSDPGGYDIVLCDLIMPNMTGIELYQQVLREQPDLAARFVFMTGGATGGAQEFLDNVSNDKLSKPFGIQTLRSLVIDLLERGERSAAVGRANRSTG